MHISARDSTNIYSQHIINYIIYNRLHVIYEWHNKATLTARTAVLQQPHQRQNSSCSGDNNNNNKDNSMREREAQGRCQFTEISRPPQREKSSSKFSQQFSSAIGAVICAKCALLLFLFFLLYSLFTLYTYIYFVYFIHLIHHTSAQSIYTNNKIIYIYIYTAYIKKSAINRSCIVIDFGCYTSHLLMFYFLFFTSQIDLIWRRAARRHESTMNREEGIYRSLSLTRSYSSLVRLAYLF